MKSLKDQLLEELHGIAGLESRPSPVSGGTALFYRGKPLAHFHNDEELDLRLTKKVIREQGLTHPLGSIHHPDRSSNSPWLEVRFNSPTDVARVVELVRLAIAEL